MNDKPNDLNAIAGPSLIGRALAAGGSSGRRLGRALRRVDAPNRGLSRSGRVARLRAPLTPRHVAALAPALILASGIVTAIGAQLLADANDRAVAALRPRSAPLLAAERAADARAAAITELRPLLEGPTVSARIERLARELPAEVRIAAIERDTAGRATLSLLAPDPDRLRGLAALAGFRQLDQRRDPSGRMLVLYQATGR